jgi:hypothetical protein
VPGAVGAVKDGTDESSSVFRKYCLATVSGSRAAALGAIGAVVGKDALSALNRFTREAACGSFVCIEKVFSPWPLVPAERLVLLDDLFLLVEAVFFFCIFAFLIL